MVKFSIDLVTDEQGKKRIISFEQMESLTSGCLMTLLRLGKMADAVEVFRITFVDLPPKGVGPRITIYFHDLLGKKCSHTTDYRFIGKGVTEPDSSSIADHLSSKNQLPKYISEHLNKCEKRIREAVKQLD